MDKQFYKSKRFWSFVVLLVTGVGYITTGEKESSEVVPVLVLTVIGIIQGFLGIATNTPVSFGGKILGKK
jgi:hypothetical protein